MSVQRLDHVNLRTRDLERSCRFYADALGMTMKPRDSGKAAGFSLGTPETVLLHIIEAKDVERPQHPAIEHFAFAGSGLRPFVQRLNASEIAFNLSFSSAEGLVSVNLRDPDDNRLHVDFPVSEWEPDIEPHRVSIR